MFGSSSIGLCYSANLTQIDLICSKIINIYLCMIQIIFSKWNFYKVKVESLQLIFKNGKLSNVAMSLLFCMYRMKGLLVRRLIGIKYLKKKSFCSLQICCILPGVTPYYHIITNTPNITHVPLRYSGHWYRLFISNDMNILVNSFPRSLLRYGFIGSLRVLYLQIP